MADDTEALETGHALLFDKAELGTLWDEGFTVVGPTLAQGAIVIDEVRTLDQLPIGWTEEQEKGTYRLKRRGDGAYFGFTVGPHSWKKYLFPPKLTLFSLEWGDGPLAVCPSPEPVPRYAFLGVRSCEGALKSVLEVSEVRMLT